MKHSSSIETLCQRWKKTKQVYLKSDMGKVLTVSQAAFSKPSPSLTTNDRTKRAHINQAILSEPFHRALAPVRALRVQEE